MRPSDRNPLWLLAGLVAVCALAAVISLAVYGRIVGVALAGGAIAYGLLVWQARRLASVEDSFDDPDDRVPPG